jgi:hypothetical protein
MEERRGNWMTNMKEYDIEIKPSNIVQRQGLCKLAIEEKENKEKRNECQDRKEEKYVDWDHWFELEAYNSDKISLNESGRENKAQMYEKEVLQILIFVDSWYYVLMFVASWRHSSERGKIGPFGCIVEWWWTLRDASEKGNLGPSGDTEWHNGGFLEITLKGLGWTPMGST